DRPFRQALPDRQHEPVQIAVQIRQPPLRLILAGEAFPRLFQSVRQFPLPARIQQQPGQQEQRDERRRPQSLAARERPGRIKQSAQTDPERREQNQRPQRSDGGAGGEIDRP
ncbi:hypothetical protein RZS08_53325, partial [Arthrospira platensis SPKY1]|nr:hypothetical protein [Arthrospira platensis SPKY1]